MIRIVALPFFSLHCSLALPRPLFFFAIHREVSSDVYMANALSLTSDNIEIVSGPSNEGLSMSQAASEEDPWNKKCVLSLDGGGIRGYASLCLLQHLMDEIAEIEQDHPGGSHNSSFLPIDKDGEVGLGASYHSRLNEIQEDEEVRPVEPVVSNHLSLDEVSASADHSRQSLDTGPNADENINSVPIEERYTATRVHSSSSQDAVTSKTPTHTMNGSALSANRQYTSPMEHEDQESIQPARQSEVEGPRYSRMNGRTASSLGLHSRQGSDLTEYETMSSVEEVTGYVPCHYFDYIAGTSTGGLNAIMLGRLRMRVEDCRARYPELAQSVFGKKRSILTRVKKMSTTKYDSVKLEEAVKTIVQAQCPPSGKRKPRQKGYAFLDFKSPEDLCRTVVVANKVGDQPTYVFRSYDHDGAEGEIKNPGEADGHQIWQVARATSAAPTYFEPINIDGVEYFDGGVGSNNPVMLLIDEVISKSGLTGEHQLVRAFDVLISIGTGQKPSKKLKVKHKLPSLSSWVGRRSLYRILHSLKDEATDVEKAHDNFKKWARDAGFRGYYRWTGGEEVGGLGIDEWHTEDNGKKPPTKAFIEENVKKYVAQPHVKAQLREAAQKLVDRRRARFLDPNRGKYGKQYHGKFGRYCYCTLLHCPWCPKAMKMYVETEDALVEHALEFHKMKEEDLYKEVGRFPHVPPKQPGGPH